MDGAMMKNKWFGLACLLAVLFVLSVSAVVAEEKKPDKKANEQKASLWMEKKLEHTQKILAGLTRADFEMVSSHAGMMQVITYLEEWDRGKNPEYKRQLRYFSDANAELIRQAGKKNIGGATLAYTQLTLSCVQCHNVVRDVKGK